MGGRELRRVGGGLVVAALIGVLGACGDDGNPAVSEQVKSEMNARAESRRTEIDLMVREGKLPPIARNLITADGAMNLDFIDGPKYAEDVVRTGPGGKTGKKLQWDLNQNGRIDRSERTITEQELYRATTQ
jgi:hypothetical protein